MNINQLITRADMPNFLNQIRRLDNGAISINGRVIKANGFISGMPTYIHENFNKVGNVGAGLDLLHTHTIGAGTLLSAGDFLGCSFGGYFANNGNTKRLLTSFDGSTVLDSGARDVSSAGINLRWQIDQLIYRITDTTIRASVLAQVGFFGVSAAGVAFTNGGGYLLNQGTNTTDITVADLDTNTIAIEVFGEATSNDDIVQDTSAIFLVQQ